MFDPIDYPYPKGYCLKLNDSNKWWITGTENAIHLAEAFASIMELKECRYNDSPRIIFSEMKEENGLGSTLCDTDWILHNYRSVNIFYYKHNDDVFCEFKDAKKPIRNYDTKYLAMWYSLQPIYKQILKSGGLPLHAGLVKFDGKGILISAKGDTGKSTCCRRLPRPWEALCDDESLAVLAGENEYLAHPFPTWSDYISDRSKGSWDVQNPIPLHAIFFIEQSEDDEVIEIDAPEAVMRITESAAQVWGKFHQADSGWLRKDYYKDAFDNAFGIAKNTRAYRLRVSLTGRFWEEIEKVI